MYEQDLRIKKYVNAVERKLRMPLDVRARVMSDFGSSISARRETGESVEEILESLGSPKKVAAELNEQMKEFAYRKSPWRWVCLAIAALGGALLLFDGITNLLAYLLTQSIDGANSVGSIGGADGPTAIFVTRTGGPSDAVVWALLVVMGVLGYWQLSRLKQK